MSLPGRPKGEYRSAQHEGTPVSKVAKRHLLMRARLNCALVLVAACAHAAALAQALIYTCTDDTGRRLTSDRPIPECLAKEQRVLNRDGSVRQVLAPTLTAEELAAREARERAAALVRAAQADAVRRDRNLLARYPNEAAHAKARETALDTVRLAIKATEQRLKELGVARKPLLLDSEFYVGKPLPARLQAALDSNQTASDAQRAAAQNQQAELERVNQLYDAELTRLRRLWAGAPAGSLAVAPGAASAARR